MAQKIINPKDLKVASHVIRALTHPLRLKILKFIDSNRSIHVNKIYKALNLEQSITSQHLRILRSSSIVKTKREGKFIYYAINYKKVASYVRSINKFLKKKH